MMKRDIILVEFFFHITDNENKKFLTAVATDSHRMAISKTLLTEEIKFDPIILPKKNNFPIVFIT